MDGMEMDGMGGWLGFGGRLSILVSRAFIIISIIPLHYTLLDFIRYRPHRLDRTTFDSVEDKDVQLTTLFSSCLFRCLLSGKISRTSLIYHFGLEGLGELRLESEIDEEVSWASSSLPQEQSQEGLRGRTRCFEILNSEADAQTRFGSILGHRRGRRLDREFARAG